jgi:hypothetical protein
MGNGIARESLSPSFSSGATNSGPSNLCTSRSHSETVQHIQGTFVLTDNELNELFLTFCYLAKKNVEANKEPVSTQHHPWEAKEEVTLTLTDFFKEVKEAQHEHSIHFLDCIFDLVGTKNLHAMTYSEFLDGVLTFGMFKFDDMVRFIFFILDKNKEGRIARAFFLRFVESIHGRKVRAFERAILPDGEDNSSTDDRVRLPLAGMRKPSVDYVALKQLCIQYPTILEPMLLFQTKLRRRIMGESWWRRKEIHIEKHFRKMEHLREKEKKRLIIEREREIRHDLGIWAYYFRSKWRNERENMYPLPIVNLKNTSAECLQTIDKDMANL